MALTEDPYNLVHLREVKAVYYCPACLELWPLAGHCNCEMRDDVPADASAWDDRNYPRLVPFPDQEAALAAYRVGGSAAVEALVAQVVGHASPPGRLP